MNVRNEASNQEVRFMEEGNYNEGNMEKKKIVREDTLL